MAIARCPDNCLHFETQDLALVPACREADGGRVLGFNVLGGGKLGSGGYRIATALDIFVTESEAVSVCRAMVEVYRDYGPRDARNAARFAFLLDDWGERKVREEVERVVGRPLARAGVDLRKTSVREHVGIYRQKQTGMNSVGLKIPVGRITGSDLCAVAELAEVFGNGEVRLSPAQAMIIPFVPDRVVGELSEHSLLKRFAYNPSPVMQGLVSCVGSDYCNLGVIETKGHALETAQALDKKLGAGVKPLTMHWSGCPAGIIWWRILGCWEKRPR